MNSRERKIIDAFSFFLTCTALVCCKILIKLCCDSGTESGACRAESVLQSLASRANIIFDFGVETHWQPINSQRMLLWASRWTAFYYEPFSLSCILTSIAGHLRFMHTRDSSAAGHLRFILTCNIQLHSTLKLILHKRSISCMVPLFNAHDAFIYCMAFRLNQRCK